MSSWRSIRNLALLLITITFVRSVTDATTMCSEVFRNSFATTSPPGALEAEAWSAKASAGRSGGAILHEWDSKLHTSVPVEKVVQKIKNTDGVILKKPADKINAWLEYLNRLSQKSNDSPLAQSVLKKAFYQQFVTKPEDVPESYYALQIKIARERGHGDIQLNSVQRKQLSDILIVDQNKSLDFWTEYLISNDTNIYPMWLKYWIFTGMTKLSKYNSATGSFDHRTKKTVAPFPELNREALAYVADIVLKKMNKNSFAEIKDTDLLKNLEGMNFGKIYGRILFNLGVGKEGNFKTNNGQWIKYIQGSNHLLLVKSLEGKNTGWCTAGEATAQMQLENGDFYVYYSFDGDGKATIPRVAIRMEMNEIAEIRGVGNEQNLDPQISQSNIVASKMKEFGTRADKFLVKTKDMENLTRAELKHRNHEMLSKEELRFLYELDKPIQGFGYTRDPRINKIRSERDLKDDFSRILGYQKNQIIDGPEDLSLKTSKVFVGPYVFQPHEVPHGTRFPEVFFGLFKVYNFENLKNIQLPKIVFGDLDLSALSSLEGLILPDTVHGQLLLGYGKLRSASHLVMPKGVSHYQGPEDILK